MCLIVYQPAGSPAIPAEWLANGWENNPHGAGFMFAHRGELVIRKGYFTLKELAEAYAQDYGAYGHFSPFIVHLRYATHGKQNEDNTHPHALNDGEVGLVHNGIFHHLTRDNTHSDTAIFCNTVLACRSTEQLLSQELNETLAAMIGRYNKLALMDGAGNVSIVNQEGGDWEGEYWLSNDSHLPGVALATVERGVTFPPSDSLWTPDLTDGEEWELRALESRVDADTFQGLTDEEWARYAELSDQAWQD